MIVWPFARHPAAGQSQRTCPDGSPRFRSGYEVVGWHTERDGSNGLSTADHGSTLSTSYSCRSSGQRRQDVASPTFLAGRLLALDGQEQTITTVRFALARGCKAALRNPR